MTLVLYSHPLASFCHKVLIALYEAETEFEAVMVDLADPGDHAAFLDLWPVGKMPVLRDHGRNRTIPESSIIIEYLDRYHRGSHPMLPDDPDACLDARLWDRFFDLYIHDPMQRIVFDRLRAEDKRDAMTVEDAERRLATGYAMIDRQMAQKYWAVGPAFSIADCAAAPALFFSHIIKPFAPDQKHLADYFERLVQRPSFRRVLIEAQPYLRYFPFSDRMPDRWMTLSAS